VRKRDNRVKAQIDYLKAKEAFRLISEDAARLEDDLVRLMLQSKYGAGICKAIRNLEKLRRCKLERLPSEETNQLLSLLGIKPGTSKRRSRKHRPEAVYDLCAVLSTN
jgi:hypothetical protein